MLKQCRRWLLLFTLGLFLVSATAHAEPTEEEAEEGRGLAKKAMTHYNDGEFEEANGLFEQARVLYPSGQVLRMSGYTLKVLEKWLDAAEMLEKALAAEYKPLLPRDAEDAQDNLDEVLKHIATLEIISGVSGAEVSIDGDDPVALPHKVRLLPGQYKLKVTAEGHKSLKKRVKLKGGDSVQHKLSPKLVEVDEPDPEPAPKPEPEPVEEPLDLFGWFPGQGLVGIATGGVGLVLGVIGIGIGGYGTSLQGAVQENIDRHNTNYDANCTRNRDLCQADIQLINRDGERAKNSQTTGLALGITGLGLAVVGATLFLFSDMSPLAPKSGSSDGPDAADDADPPEDDAGITRCGISVGGFACMGTF